jgi:hypothetical protein
MKIVTTLRQVDLGGLIPLGVIASMFLMMVI